MSDVRRQAAPAAPPATPQAAPAESSATHRGRPIRNAPVCNSIKVSHSNSGEGAVGAHEADRDQEPPCRIDPGAPSHPGQGETNDQASREVDHECAVRESGAHPVGNHRANPIPGKRTQGSTDCDKKVFLQIQPPPSTAQSGRGWHRRTRLRDGFPSGVIICRAYEAGTAV